MLISLKFPEGVAFHPIMSNLEEEIIEETTPIRGNLWKTRKASIACQDVFSRKSFYMEDRSKPRITPFDYHLECCIEARFLKMARKKAFREIFCYIDGLTSGCLRRPLQTMLSFLQRSLTAGTAPPISKLGSS